MKKVFISQPMKGRTKAELVSERYEILEAVVNYLDESVEELDNLFGDKYPDEKPLWHLGESLKLLSSADLVVFANGWKEARGCNIEHECAVRYEIPFIEAWELIGPC